MARRKTGKLPFSLSQHIAWDDTRQVRKELDRLIGWVQEETRTAAKSSGDIDTPDSLVGKLNKIENDLFNLTQLVSSLQQGTQTFSTILQQDMVLSIDRTIASGKFAVVPSGFTVDSILTVNGTLKVV